jgi:hypothetical protein
MQDFIHVRPDLVKELREDLRERRITIRHVSVVIEKSYSQTWRIINGQNDTDFATWEKIASLCGKRFYLRSEEV